MATPLSPIGRSPIGLSLIGLSALAFAIPAAATTPTIETATQIVEYSDLDLSTAKGQERLETRIKSAVRSVCRERDARSIVEQRLVKQCKLAATSAAMRDAKVVVANYQQNRRMASGSPPIVGN